jgi:hypothetical protein
LSRLKFSYRWREKQAYNRKRTLVWYGKTYDERVEVRVEVYPCGETVVRIKDGRQLHPNRASHLYKSEARAAMAVKTTVEWLGYTIKKSGYPATHRHLPV